jgi:hypothetical protein
MSPGSNGSTPLNTYINYCFGQGWSTYKGRKFRNHVARLAFVVSLLQKNEFDFLEDMFRKALKHLIEQMPDLGLSNDDLLRLVKKVIDLSCVIDLRSDFLAVAKESFYRNADWISDVSYLVEFLELCPKVSGADDKDRVVQTIDVIVDNLDDDDPQLLSDELSSLEEIEQKSRLGLQKQIESVRCLLSHA